MIYQCLQGLAPGIQINNDLQILIFHVIALVHGSDSTHLGMSILAYPISVNIKQSVLNTLINLALCVASMASLPSSPYS